MHIDRVQIEEGFLDGLDVHFVPGLNVVIGARGTGKTSLIELVRFCLDVRGFAAETAKRSQDHALSVLGTGQVTVTLTENGRQVIVTRTATDKTPRSTGPFTSPIVFSQTEIETVGLQPNGRLGLIDSFLGDMRRNEAEEGEAVSEVRSLTKEVDAIRRELDDYERHLAEIPSIDQQLDQLMPAEQLLAKSSTDVAAKKQSLDVLSKSIASTAVALTSTERFSQAVTRWRATIVAAAQVTPPGEVWSGQADDNPLPALQERAAKAAAYIQQALAEINAIDAESRSAAARFNKHKVDLEDQARQLRKEIETLQEGAGTTARQGQQLRERKAQLESLRTVAQERNHRINLLLNQRNAALDRLETVREARFNARVAAADKLNHVLGPKIQIVVTRAGQYDAYASAIAEVLRGSGLRYGELAPTLAKSVSPRELMEAADAGDVALISEAAGITKDRAVRTISQLKDSDLGALATINVEDVVSFQLLDGTDYKDISQLSTGQRCTVILPLVLRHTERLLIVDQPEDHIDNAFIADTLIRAIMARDPSGQILFSTHNANIPVLGNADRVVQLGSDGRRGFALVTADLNSPAAVHAITSVMEGGIEAFGRRASFYGRRKAK
ncbi:Chromosome partition protein Smc [Paludisphaera borealis]|uniref:Chromosome partition protein Smc n=2 Tax=Paludisphaera borealis TaxID=1387353 RepID=A0A1U7CI51_9BACT|nr:Chromosome partition protein Smc [Paludisphaera borealis]